MSALAGIQKEKIRSIIMCSDREFKSKAVLFLNAAAFPAEKTTVDNIDDAIHYFNGDPIMINFVIDGSMLSPHDLEKSIQKFNMECRNQNVKLLIILDEAQLEEKERFEGIYDKTFLEKKPLRQAQFNRAFHSKQAKVNTKEIGPTIAPSSQSASDSSNKPALSLIETSTHIKDTIDMINSLSKDRANIEIVADIGQRFNGLIGAFHFFGNKEGYPKLRHLAEIIDAIGRTYQEIGHGEISIEHHQMLVDAAKCSYLILKDMREGDGIDPERLKSHDELTAKFEGLEDVKHRDNQDQDAIDQMLSEQMKSS